MAIQLSRYELLRAVRPWHNDSARVAVVAAAFFLMAGLAATSVAQTGYLTYPTGISPSGVTAADLNGDGLPDLVIANSGSNSLTVLLNNGTGGFTALPPIVLGQSNSAFANLEPSATIAVDLNGDHKIDLVVLSGIPAVPFELGTPYGLLVLLGNGDGTFQPPIPVSSCFGTFGAQVADLNGDGIPDLVTMCPSGGPLPNTLFLLMPGKGDGTFGSGVPLPAPASWFAPPVFTIGDFNQDGKPDIAVATGNTLALLLNDGNGNFTPIINNDEPWGGVSGIAAGDFNGDGLLDLAVCVSLANQDVETIMVLLGQSDGTFQAAPSLQAPGCLQIVAMDLNGDGHVDLALGIPYSYYSPALGPTDLVFYAGRGDGTFENGLPFSGSGSTGYVAFADFTGSGVIGFAGTNDFTAPVWVPTAGNTVILPRAVWPSLTLANTSAAGFGLGPLAPGSIAAAFGANLAAETAQPTGTPPVSLGAVTASVTDSAGTARPAQLFYVSPTQVNYLIPANTAPGLATVTIAAGGDVTATGQIEILPVAPALFTVNANSLVAANVLLVSQNGDQTYESIYQTDQNGNITALPIDFGSATDTVYLLLYGTGIRNLTSLSAVTATVGWSLNAPVTYAGPQCCYVGLDQVNLQLPRSLAASTPFTTVLQLTMDGQPSNQVTLLIQ
jgi:uncharacterized protein (TIGR03437 family)